MSKCYKNFKFGGEIWNYYEFIEKRMKKISITKYTQKIQNFHHRCNLYYSAERHGQFPLHLQQFKKITHQIKSNAKNQVNKWIEDAPTWSSQRTYQACMNCGVLNTTVVENGLLHQ